MSLPESDDSSPGDHDMDQVEAVARRLSVHAGAPWGLDRIDSIGEPAVSGAGGARNMLAHSCPAARLSSLRWRSYRLPRPRTLVACPPDRWLDRRRIRRRRPNGNERARVHRGHGRAGLARRLRKSRGQREHGEARTSRRLHTPAARATRPPTMATRSSAPTPPHPPTAQHPIPGSSQACHVPPPPSSFPFRRLAFTPSATRVKLSTASSPLTALGATGTAPTWPRLSAA